MRRRVLVACAALSFSLFVGCDFTPGFGDVHEAGAGTGTETEGCGGEGVLCNVSGVAGQEGNSGDGGPALEALHNYPVDVAMTPLTLAPTGEIFVVDWYNHSVRRIGEDGTISRYIGSGDAGDSFTGPAAQVQLNYPTGMTIGYDGNYYLTSWQSAQVGVVNAQSMTASVLAGSGLGFGGDGGPAAQAKLNLPSSVIFDPENVVYISDQGNQRIRAIDAQGLISTYAGGEQGYHDDLREDAQFNFGSGDHPLPGGKISMNTHDWVIYIADTENHRIRRINYFTGQVVTIAGTGEPGYSGDGGNAHNAQLNEPTDVIFAEDHRIYIADSGNNVIRKVDAFGLISTVVGTGEAGFSPDETPAAAALLNRPMGIFYDEHTRTLYIADTYNHQIKRVYDPY